MRRNRGEGGLRSLAFHKAAVLGHPDSQKQGEQFSSNQAIISSKPGNFKGDCTHEKGVGKRNQLLSLSNFWHSFKSQAFCIFTWNLHSSEEYRAFKKLNFCFRIDLGNSYLLHRRTDTRYHVSQHFYFQIQCSILISTPLNWVIKFFSIKHF